MLDFVYYPVSALLWVWHTVFANAFGSPVGIAWVLSIAMLVVTIRAALLPLFLKQARTQERLRELQPKITAVRRKHPDDRARQATEIQRLYKDNGVRMSATLLPMIGQILVFLGLFHVLRSFDRTGGLAHIPFLTTATPMSQEQNAHTANYLLGAADVRSFLHTDLFGAALSSTVSSVGGTAAIVGIALGVIAAVTTHFIARVNSSRQAPAPGQSAMRMLSLWVFPLGALVAGMVMPIAILLYYAVNNAWTLAQQHFLLRRLDAEALARHQQTALARTQAAPKPGVKPQRARH